MEEEKFLPGGRLATSRALATVRYSRESLSRIAGGGNPADERLVPQAQAVWGILYTCDGFVGFFVPRVETSFALLPRDAGKAADDINLAVPDRAINGVSLSLPPPPRTCMGKLIGWLSGVDRPFRLSWDSGTRYLDFSIMRGSDSFTRELSSRFPPS